MFALLISCYLVLPSLCITAHVGSGAFRLQQKRFQATIVHAIEQAPNVTNVSATAAGQAVGVTTNESGDLTAFLSALVFDGGCVLLFIAVFMKWREWYPLIFNRNVNEKIAPCAPEGTRFGWARATLSTTTAEAADSIGLDNAMLLQFSQMAAGIMFRIGAPMLLIMGPVHYLFGGKAAGDDHMSYLSMGNVEMNSHLYWIHAIVVWAVVLIVERSVFQAQEKFMVLRFEWLRKLARPQANSVMVEEIPEKYRSDEELSKFFTGMFGEGSVKSAYVAKDTYSLSALFASKVKAQKKLDSTVNLWERHGKDSSKRPQKRDGTDVIDVLTKDVQQIKALIKEKQDQLLQDSLKVGGVNSQNGFVTFRKRSDAEVALKLTYLPDTSEMVVSLPPQPRAVLWTDLQQGSATSTIERLIGYALVAGLFLVYLPAVLWISTIAQKFDMGPLQPFWVGLAPTLGLQIMVAFLPTFLILIFRCFFTLYDDNRAQHKLQNWYFVFQVTYVILVTSISSNIVTFVKTAVTNPFALPLVFGQTMPSATHFYCNFIVLQWFSHAMNITRYIPLIKFLIFRRMYSEKEAADMAEPEDQDYYGIGSRSARHVINLLIGIIFCTLCPPITVLVWMNFILCRVVYGYLIIFAETKKPDLGGEFWVTKLKHVYVGLVIYVALMAGVLYGRSEEKLPATFVGIAIIQVAWSYSRFLSKFEWEKLPFSEIVKVTEAAEQDGQYVQPELIQL